MSDQFCIYSLFYSLSFMIQFYFVLLLSRILEFLIEKSSVFFTNNNQNQRHEISMKFLKSLKKPFLLHLLKLERSAEPVQNQCEIGYC
ncbi:hypothetical protein BpHYR1_014746 [Brachionus plicatilis]|uniref:Uncharacterized protein n=1 Tax=Brachionus plicatilis TaxID=10195 RepID=A0A3M7S3Q1_BRAPC|nr:hypothetical protein BpHYR1_014746 [Brachionus plicatilis]